MERVDRLESDSTATSPCWARGPRGWSPASGPPSAGPGWCVVEKNRRAGRQDPDVRRDPVQHHQRPRPAPARGRFRADRPGVRPAPRAGACGPSRMRSGRAARSSARAAAGWTSTRRSACSRRRAWPPRSRATARSSPSRTGPSTSWRPLTRGWIESGRSCGSQPGPLGRAQLTAARAASGFVVGSTARSLTARRVILAVGGQSYPGCGTSGDGYAIARRVRPHDRRDPPRPGAHPGRARLGRVAQGPEPSRRRRVGPCRRGAGRSSSGARRSCSPTSA